MEFQKLIVISLLTLILLVCGNDTLGMPPAPHVIEDYRERGELDVLAEKLERMRDNGVGQLSPLTFKPHSGKLAQNGDDTARLRVLVILVDFSDHPASGHQVADATAADFQRTLFSRGETQFGSLTEFYLANSYGSLLVEGDVVGWYRMPLTYAEYRGSGYGTQHTKPNAQTMARHACEAAEADVDFTQYDNDGDGYVEGIFVIHAGPGAEEIPSPNDTLHIWSHAWWIDGGYVSDDGVEVNRYSTEPEELFSSISSIGVFCHEFGHTLGLPDLYDVSDSSYGIGDWGLMGGGSWNLSGKSPASYTAWSKHVLDSLYGTFGQTVDVASNLTDVVLHGSSTDSVRYRLFLPSQPQGYEYFLVENRTKTGFDRSLPGEGLMIWHCDDNLHGSNNIHLHGHLRVGLEQADGKSQLEEGENQGDLEDPFPGTFGDLTEFSDRTNPSSDSYYTGASEASVWNIQRDPETGAISCNIDANYSRACIDFTDLVFSDSTYGNGDGVLDAGERIQVLFTLQNRWLDAVNLSIEVSSPAAELEFDSDRMVLPTVARGVMYDNYDQPFEFDIPDDVSSVKARFDFSLQSDTPLADSSTSIYKFVGETEILVVDDDGSSAAHLDRARFYTQTLDSLLLPHDYWDIVINGIPAEPQLAYKYIIWFTGDKREEQLSHDDVEFLRDYLDQGGSLFLTGQDIAEGLSSTSDSTFLTDYLKIRFMSSGIELDVYGEAGNTVGDGMQMQIIGHDGASNQASADRLEIVSAEAEAPFTYKNGEAAGSVFSEVGNYRLVFFGFGFEGIRNTKPDYNKRDEVMVRVLDFLEGNAATAVVDEAAGPSLPQSFSLSQNYPNPFNPTTIIEYSISPYQAGKDYSLLVYNVLGQEVQTLAAGIAGPGVFRVEFDGSGLSSGVYFYRLIVGTDSETRKMLLVK
jgi:immune inhibitor A